MDRNLRLVDPTSWESVQSPLMFGFLSEFPLTGSSASSVLAWTDGTMQTPTSSSSVSLKARQRYLSRGPIIISSSCMRDDIHGGTSCDNPNGLKSGQVHDFGCTMIRCMSTYNCIQRTRSVYRHVCCWFLRIYWLWYVCMK